jgi:hypothetical protein
VDEPVVIATPEAASSTGAHEHVTDAEPANSSQAHRRKDMPQGGASRRPLPARIALSVLLLSLCSLLLLMVWQPTALTPPATRLAKAPPIPKAPVPSEREVAEPAADLTPHSPSQRAVVASVTDQAQRESPRDREAPAQDRSSGGPIQLGGSGSESVLQPMVYMHVRDHAQRARVERLIAPLAQRGIVVTGIKVVDIGPQAPDLRYFRSEEAHEAARVAQSLGAVGMPTPRLKRIPGLESRSRPRQYELWLAPENLSGSS